jgi:hypothetical protein
VDRRGLDPTSADTFIGKLACSYFAPGSGPATSDGSEYCDPAVDRQITQAAALEVDLLSRRAGNFQYNPVWGALIDQLWVR